ncbi:MAG: helix-turn-helix domain-containing protein [Actinomycetota bacterium]
MANQQELGALIRESRLKSGMSLGQLASAIGRSSSSVRRWERGEVAPAVTVLPKLAAILDIDPKDLEAARPPAGDVEETADHGTEEATDGRVSTVEQPVVEPPNGSEIIPEVEVAPQTESSGLLSDFLAVFTGGTRSWIGWARGLLTATALIVMLFVLVWAVGELLEAFGDVWDSFDVGSNDTQSP